MEDERFSFTDVFSRPIGVVEIPTPIESTVRIVRLREDGRTVHIRMSAHKYDEAPAGLREGTLSYQLVSGDNWAPLSECPLLTTLAAATECAKQYLAPATSVT